jgi:uncharacterized protein YndB with AHSA1/START domain
MIDVPDVPDEIGRIQREVRDGRLPAGAAKSVLVRRTYPAPVEDVWDAITDPERISRWFLPVTGDLRLGGKYQLEGNAGGEILRCEPPRLLKVSWIYGDAEPGSSEVEVRLSAAGGGATVFELEHAATVDPRWGQFGPGAVGIGWDLGLLGLGLHLAGASLSTEDRQAWPATEEGKQYMTLSGRAWGAAHRASGASQAEADTAAENTIQAYTGAPE